MMTPLKMLQLISGIISTHWRSGLLIRRERRDSGEGEERGLRNGAERGYRDREKRDKRELS